jgi:predicted permease
MPLPLFLLSPTTSWPVAALIIGAFAFFTPLINAPIIGILTVRTPVELRPKVMTAVMTVATMAGPFGFIAAGYALRHVALGPFFLALPALLTLGSLLFAAVLLRHREDVAGEVAVASG